MKNLTYEKDYQRDWELSGTASADNCALSSVEEDPAFLQHCRDCEAQRTSRVNPKDKDTYERLLKKCGDLAQQYGGKVEGLVSYELWEAKIKLTLPFFEYFYPREKDLIRDITENAQGFWFTSAGEREIQLTILIYYFNLPEEKSGPYAELAP